MTPKRSVADLAIAGGPPAFAEVLHVGRPNLGDRQRFLHRIGEAFDRRWLTNDGPLVRQFEEQIAQRIGARHSIAVCNATVGLQIAARAAGLSGEVIVPSLTFVATAHALEWIGLVPVFCDVDPRTRTLDAARVEDLVGPRTSAIVGVHLWGRPCEVDALGAVAARRGLKLLFDAAHAFGCTRLGIPVGRFGDAEVFSFHATKVCNSFEGGAICTSDDGLAAAARRMRSFGFADHDLVVSPGTNGKMSEAAAAMGLTSLEGMESFVEANRQNHALYRERLAWVPGLSIEALEALDPAESHNFHNVVVEVDREAAGLSRDELLRVLQAENVLARRYFYPGCHAMEPYRSREPGAAERLPVTTRLLERVLSLPTGTAVGPEEVTGICDLIAFAVSRAGEIARRLRGG